MKMDAHLETAVTLLQPWTEETAEPEPYRLDVIVSGENLVTAVAALHGAGWGFLSAITGVDLGVEDGHVEVLYHFCDGPYITTLRVHIPRDNGQIDSVCGVIPSAGFFERELSEMLGVTVVGTPNPDRLFLPEDWPAGVHPLRKDFTMEQLS
jgi:Ni,Fe-hydrogenase III component G